ncbi:uncharacterized protein V6R79_024045 [Siganus canaliculatus]
MALPMFRGCFRLPGTFSFTRVFLCERIIPCGSLKARLLPPSAAAVAAAVRPYSSDRGGHKPNQKVVVVGIPNPFIWFRTKIYYFLIRAYFDKDFNIEEFTEGAKQAFSHVSRLLSQCQFEALEGLVAKDVSMEAQKVQTCVAQSVPMFFTAASVKTVCGVIIYFTQFSISLQLIAKLEEKCNLLPLSHKKALSADSDEIMYTTPGDVGIYYDDNGQWEEKTSQNLKMALLNNAKKDVNMFVVLRCLRTDGYL